MWQPFPGKLSPHASLTAFINTIYLLLCHSLLHSNQDKPVQLLLSPTIPRIQPCVSLTCLSCPRPCALSNLDSLSLGSIFPVVSQRKVFGKITDPWELKHGLIFLGSISTSCCELSFVHLRFVSNTPPLLVCCTWLQFYYVSNYIHFFWATFPLSGSLGEHMAIIHMGKGRLWVVSSSQDLMEAFVGSVPCSRAPQQCIKGVSAPPITPPPCVCTGGLNQKPSASQPRPPADWATNTRERMINLIPLKKADRLTTSLWL